MIMLLLTTKLYIPKPRPDLVPRPRLIQQLNTGTSRKLTIISAPAGFGKSTLLSAWVRQVDPGTCVAWLSLDDGDNDLVRFLTYFVAALQTTVKDVGQGIMAALQSPETVNIDAVLTALINEMAKFTEDVVLILDDYHVIESQPIDQAITFFLENLPNRIHLVIASRIDPSLPLSRLRARGQMTEIRADDLRFTLDETAAFLKQAVNFDLSDQDTAALGERTEGWIAGLQLSALSIKGLKSGSEITDFVNRFTGSDRYIHDYLVDEVLQHQPKEVKDFLLKTSILEMMSAGLCDALTGEATGQVTLEKLERGNLFILPLDHRREWYRYHQLFSDLLHHRLTQTYPEWVEDLHARASHWLDKNGFQNQAIKHALAMKDKYLAADLIERHTKSLLYQGKTQIRSMLGWFDQFPKEMITERPLLQIYRAWTLVFENPFKNKNTVEKLLIQIQKSMEGAELDKIKEGVITGHIFSIQGLLSQPPIQTDHDPKKVLALFKDAIRLFPPDDVSIRCGIHIGIAYEYMHLENTEAASKASQNAFLEACSANNPLVAFVALRNQAMVAYYQGKLSQAIEICQTDIHSLNQLHTQSGQPFPSLEILSIAKGFFLIERGEIENAERALAKGFETLQFFNEYETISLGNIAMVRLFILKGETQRPLQAIEQYKQHWPNHVNLLEILNIQVVLSCCQDDPAMLKTILRWSRKNEPNFGSDADIQGITPWAEIHHLVHLTWIQAQITLFYLESDTSDLSPLLLSLNYLEQRLNTAERHGLVFRVIEYLVLKSIVLDAIGKSEDAENTISQALSIAAKEGFQRVFLEKGKPMASLLKRVFEYDRSNNFIHRLLAGFEKIRDVNLSPISQNLVVPLSERELEVLQLVAQGHTNREISERLFLALDTIKGHNRRIYSKLGVQNRTEAVNHAHELGLLKS